MNSYAYQVGGSLRVNALSYVVRQADTDLYQALRAGELCCVLNSRQMGKSSLRVRMRHQLQQMGVVCASLDMARIGSQHITRSQWYKSIAFELLHDFGLLTAINFNQWWNNHNRFSELQRLSLLLEEILIVQFPQASICIFVDEIDSVFDLPFTVHGFLTLIYECYKKRVYCSAYSRLTWALFGVAHLHHLVGYDSPNQNWVGQNSVSQSSVDPSLVAQSLVSRRSMAQIDTNDTDVSFNTPRLLELRGFQEHEAQPLIAGLLEWVHHPQAVLRSILAWTGGQPFLTQKICQLVVQESQISVNRSFFPPGTELLWVEQLVRSHIIQNWEMQDQPEHLRTIQNYLLRNKRQAQRLLELYRQILRSSNVPMDHTLESTELLLSGLVESQKGMLRVKNSIYREVFNSTWVEKQLRELCSCS
ncbi:AAA-like domain-containing protein [Oscillatoria sp. FACHB-1407]|uniref:AAA-like domain-containing protein n=1 Tax=Oscillatoria sp. FACHB-1407 TaxID=2692847 RepID=UPI001683FA25|nr:AAA-like domain-containing protein [Oscillatoria sp. FACHB-1407]MBD2459807.1 AAA-like domain-containing protein [Oscillatoria sp. FACHB-1407]